MLDPQGLGEVFGREQQNVPHGDMSPPEILEVYNNTGIGMTGVHYDPVFDAEVYGQIWQATAEESSSKRPRLTVLGEGSAEMGTTTKDPSVYTLAFATQQAQWQMRPKLSTTEHICRAMSMERKCFVFFSTLCKFVSDSPTWHQNNGLHAMR